MKVPRDVDASDLITVFVRYGYTVTRQTGSHIRLSKQSDEGTHNITIPNHSPIKVGTLQSIIRDFCNKNDLSIDEIYRQL